MTNKQEVSNEWPTHCMHGTDIRGDNGCDECAKSDLAKPSTEWIAKAAEQIANEWAKNTSMVRGFLGVPAPNAVAMDELRKIAVSVIERNVR